MLFNSYSFPIFFALFFLVYIPLPHALRRVWLLLASCVFYMVLIPKYILILFFLIGVDYLSGIGIEKSIGSRRKTILTISILANIGILFVFKYFNFFASEVSHILSLFGLSHRIELLTLVLPVGLSFHTFQSLSYVIEVFYRRQKAETNLLTYALYVMFWPQLVAGPIERPQQLLHQLRDKQPFDSRQVVLGFRLILLGFLKKMVIADRLAIYVDAVFQNPSGFSGVPLILATYFFTIQIYCDFSGYTDIARGLSRLMGIELSQNFNFPYLATSISDFWRRWHISLSSWFRDYVYIPLGGNRVGAFRRNINIAAVFLLSGLWHGAQWTFVIWGGVHGLYLIFSEILQPIKTSLQSKLSLSPEISTFINRLITFHLVAFAWIFFRAGSLKDAWYVVSHLFSQTVYAADIPNAALSLRQLTIRFAMIALLLILEWRSQNQPAETTLSKLQPWQRWGLYYAGVAAVMMMGVFETAKFIYFQF